MKKSDMALLNCFKAASFTPRSICTPPKDLSSLVCFNALVKFSMFLLNCATLAAESTGTVL